MASVVTVYFKFTYAYVFIVQIAVGSTNVRVGSIIFGARDYHTATTTAATST